MTKPVMYAAPDPDLSARDPQQLPPDAGDTLPDKTAIADWHDKRRDAVWGDYDLIWNLSPAQIEVLKAGGALVICVDSETGGQLLIRMEVPNE